MDLPNEPDRPYAGAFRWTALLLVALVAGCASSAETVTQKVTVVIEIKNDVAPSTDGILYLRPVWGDRDDRIELGVVRGGEEGTFRVTIPAQRYRLTARRLFTSAADPHSPQIPNSRSGTQFHAPFHDTDRFTVTADTRSIVWHMRARGVTVK